MYYRQPRYYNDFHCIGNACVDNCCYGWRIDWKKSEIDKLKTAENISAEFMELIEKSFVPIENHKEAYRIEFNEKGKCPFLTNDSLCRIQRELGVEYMSDTCMIYPRKRIVTDKVVYCFCYSSCREIMWYLMNDEKSMDLINVPVKHSEILHGVIKDSSERLTIHPELKFREELFEFFYDTIADKKHDVETNIILGALAAQALTKLVEIGESDKIPETIKSFKAQMHNGAQLKIIENIKPNYHLRFGFIGKILKEIVGYSMVGLLNDKSGTPNINYYNIASEHLNEIFSDRPFFLRNIALNLLFEFIVPFSFTDKKIFENYSLFAVAYACLKLNMISIAINGKDGKYNINMDGNRFHYEGDDRFINLTSRICRPICQNYEKQKVILKLLEENKFTSPAYLALLVK